MIIHKQGIKIILIISLFLFGANFLVVHFLSENHILKTTFNTFSILFFVLVVSFFRNPKRKVIENEYFVLSPADGEVVVIEKVQENEFFNEEKIQISIFMTIFNVHKNWIPMSGDIVYAKYHEGKYFMANYPKSSQLNEHNSIVIKNNKNQAILVKQIAGFIARRIVCNFKLGDKVKQDEELGFIKFGSRLDVFLPLDAKINVKLGDKVVGGLSVLADLPANV